MRKAVTLIELIVVIVIVGILTYGLATFITQIVKTWQFVDFRNDVAQEGKKALDWMVRDIREIKDNDSILIADSSHIRFVNSNSEVIDFILSGNTIQRTKDALTSPLCDYVESLEFEYRRADGKVLGPLPLSLGQRKQVKSIRISITLKRGDEDISFSSVVFPRSL